MASKSFLQNHLLYLLCSLLGVVASRTLAVVDAVSNGWHAVVCAVLSLLPKARVRFPVSRPSSHYHPAVLVTGTSSGIGHDTAVALAARGYTVFAGVRSWEDGARVESHFLAASASASISVSASVSAPVANGPISTDHHASTDHLVHTDHHANTIPKHQILPKRRMRRMNRRHAADHPQAPAVRTEENVSDGAGCIIPVILDVVSSDSVDRAYARVTEELERRNIPLVGVVNNAGVTAFGPMDMSAPSFIDHCMAVNFHGPVRVTQKFMPLLRASSGRIVNVSSIMTWLIGPGFGVYCASKAALTAASRAWHYELAANGISVAVVEPGITRTALWSKVESQLELHHARLNGVRLKRKPRIRSAAPAAMPGDEAVASVSPERHTLPSVANGNGPSDNSAENQAIYNPSDGSAENQALYNPMLRRIKTSSDLAPIFALPTCHAVSAITHALTSQYPKSTYRVGWDARLMGLATWVASEEVVEWLCRVIGIVSEN
ncbi:hypothetical protein GGF42_007053 [Coemansia sp. RSA 2424]|nr:hypothetical protein GGF42_007053 [Coemansia sp. RSA 2424]